MTKHMEQGLEFENDPTVAQQSELVAHNGLDVGSNPTAATSKEQAALDLLNEIGAAGCIFELGEHINTIRTALSAPRVPVIDGLYEAILDLNNNVCGNGAISEYSENSLDTVMYAARAYAELQKGN